MLDRWYDPENGGRVEGLGAYVRAARRRQGWTLREAARQVGLSHSRLFELESGVSSRTGKPVVPTQANLEALASGYGLPLDHLFALAHFPGYLSSRDGLSAEELGLVALYRSLPAASRQFWVAMGEGLRHLPSWKD